MSGTEAGTAQWDDVPVATAPPQEGYIELSENGWGALVGWAALTNWPDPDCLVRVPDRLEDHIVTVTCTTRDGTEKWSRPRTPEEQAEVDESVNTYLLDGGVPVRPPGYRWFLRLPPGCTEGGLWAAAGTAESEGSVHPRDIAPRIIKAIADLYANADR